MLPKAFRYFDTLTTTTRLYYNELTYKGYSVFNKLIIDQPKRQLKPFKENEACFMFVNKGDFSVRTPDQLMPFNPEKGLLAKCFNFFVETTEIQRKGDNKMELIGVYLYPSIVEELFDISLATCNHSIDYNAKQLQVDKLLNHFREGINLLLDNPELADETMVRTKLKEFIILISKTENARSYLDFMSALFRTNVVEFKSTIQNNVHSNLSVEELALLCGMSLSSFKRKFAETYNESPKKYLNRMRLERAATLLLSGDERISSIAYDLGYETVSTFNRSFKSHFGASPGQYRLDQTAKSLG